METKDLACVQCGLIGEYDEHPGTGPHHGKLVCHGCGAFRTWLKKPRISKADLPPSDKSLLFLRSLGYVGQVPATQKEASLHINARLVEKRRERDEYT